MLGRFGQTLVALTISSALFAPLLNAPAAFSQERRSSSILEFFGIRQAKPKVVVKPVKRAKKKIISKTKKNPGRKKPSFARTRQATIIERVTEAPINADAPINFEKSTNAKTVLVVGDFMAGGLSEGLASAFELEAGVVILDKSRGSSGFVREDVYNWPQNLTGLVAETKPAVIVAMIGTNDRQQMVVNNVREAIQSPAWSAEYERRVSAFADAAKASGVPLVWVGVPPFKQQSMRAGILEFNDLYRKKAESVSGSFVDIWDGFLDDQGMFTINGVDHTGQPAKLRASDGINLTKAGRRKVAFFAEKPIRVALGSLPEQTPLAVSIGPFALPGPVKPVSNQPENVTSLPPLSLFDPAFDGGEELMGSEANAPTANLPNLPADALYLRGEMPAPQPGRNDELRIREKITPTPKLETGSVQTKP